MEKVDPQDSGDYECLATNSEGRVRAEVGIKVRRRKIKTSNKFRCYIDPERVLLDTGGLEEKF